MNMEKLNEVDQSEWNASSLVWEPKCVDPPHVNSMKRAEVTSVNGNYSNQISPIISLHKLT